ncbi:XRE family transcriptional regulator [Geitlerinema sp. P-1104]|uniref:helix-turn-helix domain-containing protein n=1 Tax=Geitlerinema sp. P-1104 TaxID=2546230 RepID=UPI0014772B94|nr:XRE family transcriptional regulator [Geitlerinema sp. P-1104]
MEASFGQVIRSARKELGLSQRGLAQQLELDFTYLSKLENDRADYAAKEEVIRSIAQCLNLNAEELVFLAGRTPRCYERFLKQHAQDLPPLFRRMSENPDFAAEVFRQARQPHPKT